jgi:hypothetical protein
VRQSVLRRLARVAGRSGGLQRGIGVSGLSVRRRRSATSLWSGGVDRGAAAAATGAWGRGRIRLARPARLAVGVNTEARLLLLRAAVTAFGIGAIGVLVDGATPLLALRQTLTRALIPLALRDVQLPIAPLARLRHRSLTALEHLVQ